jgi:hypothetical protein
MVPPHHKSLKIQMVTATHVVVAAAAALEPL